MLDAGPAVVVDQQRGGAVEVVRAAGQVPGPDVDKRRRAVGVLGDRCLLVGQLVVSGCADTGRSLRSC
ncbi:hypothetical protein ASE03_12555 [Kitasatospora sp. Root187]|nr:hypothetical protein ASC99_20630 [Kitasatospora sp. Root107]KRB60435.1 hypothetical protein ASE03_12555 [Kitasatospora sp. Root187]